jgi:hypothetical protein
VSLVIQISCDQSNRYGTCVARTLPARTVEEAMRRAERDGWLLRPRNDRCPTCSGSSR